MWWSQDPHQVYWATDPEPSIPPAEARVAAKPRSRDTGTQYNQPRTSTPEVAVTKPLTLILWVSLSNFLIFIPQKKKKI